MPDHVNEGPAKDYYDPRPMKEFWDLMGGGANFDPDAPCQELTEADYLQAWAKLVKSMEPDPAEMLREMEACEELNRRVTEEWLVMQDRKQHGSRTN